MIFQLEVFCLLAMETDRCQTKPLPDISVTIRQFSKSALQRAFHLARRALCCLLQRQSRMFDDGGLVPLEPCFQHAVIFLAAGCAGVEITEGDFNSRDMFVEMDQLLLNQTLDNVFEDFTPADVVVRTNLDVHADTLRKLPRKCKGWLGLRYNCMSSGDVAQCSGSSALKSCFSCVRVAP